MAAAVALAVIRVLVVASLDFHPCSVLESRAIKISGERSITQTESGVPKLLTLNITTFGADLS
jgi:hypothetical protein